MRLDHSRSNLPPVHVKCHSVLVHIHRHPYLHPVWNLRTATATRKLLIIFPNASSFGEVRNQVRMLVRILEISSLLVDNPERKDLVTDLLNKERIVIPPNRRKGLFREQLVTSKTTNLLNPVTLDFELPTQKFVVFVNSNVHLLPKNLQIAFIGTLAHQSRIHPLMPTRTRLLLLYLPTHHLQILAQLFNRSVQLYQTAPPPRNDTILLLSFRRTIPSHLLLLFLTLTRIAIPIFFLIKHTLQLLNFLRSRLTQLL